MNPERLASSRKQLEAQHDALTFLLKAWPEKIGPASRMRSMLERTRALVTDCLEWIGENEKEFDC